MSPVKEHEKVNEIDNNCPYSSLQIDSLMLKVFSFSIEQNFNPTIDDNNIYIGIIKRKEMIR